MSWFKKTAPTVKDSGTKVGYVPATLTGVAVILILLIPFGVSSYLLSQIWEIIWSALTGIWPSLGSGWEAMIGKDPDTPLVWGKTLLRLASLGQIILSIWILWTFVEVKGFALKEFQATQLEILSTRIATVANGRGLELYWRRRPKKGKPARESIPIIAYHPDILPIRSRRAEAVVKAVDKQSNPILFQVRFVGKVINPRAVYHFNGLDQMIKQVQEMLGGALNAYMVDKEGYTLKKNKSGVLQATLNKKVYQEGRQQITDILNGSEYFVIKTLTLPSGKPGTYYQYIVDEQVVYEFQEIQIVDATFSSAIAAALEKLQLEQIDATNEAQKGDLQKALVQKLVSEGVEADLAALIAAKAMGNEPSGSVVYTTAQTLVTGGAPVVVGTK